MTAPSDEHMRLAEELAEIGWLRTHKQAVKAIYAALQSTAEKARAEERERCAETARNRFTIDRVVKNKAGKPYLTGEAAIYAGKQIAAAIMAEKETGQ
ncbi:hypothetical protein QBK99_11260 [Corticibacterium sp. UT-5YL-CI-8]|nr:hypothetical protein [Tianweitania sp. UT-5YL-CI-8]